MPTPHNRRQFLQTATLGSLAFTGAAATQPFGNIAAAFTWEKVKANRALTPFFLAEDLIRLVQLSDLPKNVRQALDVNQDYLQLGKSWDIKSTYLAELIRQSKKNWKIKEEQDQAFTQFALVCGTIVHRTFAQHLEAEATSELSERDLYRDTYLMKMLQNADPHRKKIQVDQELTAIQPSEVAELMHLVQQRNLIRMHTIRPEFSDIEQWLEDFLSYYELLKRDNERYGEVYCRPEKQKVARYVTGPKFYDETDAVIRVVRNFQMAIMDTPETIASGLNVKNPNSVYGRALQGAFQKIRALGNYVVGENDNLPQIED